MLEVQKVPNDLRLSPSLSFARSGPPALSEPLTKPKNSDHTKDSWNEQFGKYQIIPE
jgi:hypothetical protein